MATSKEVIDQQEEEAALKELGVDHSIYSYATPEEAKDKDVKLEEIDVFDINVRRRMNLPDMMNKIREAGRIMTRPVLVEVPKDERESWGLDRFGRKITKPYIIGQGNRRIGAARKLVADELTPHGLVERLNKIKCTVYTGITRPKMESIIMDHDSVKLLERCEIISCIYRNRLTGATATEIANKMAQQLISLFALEKKKPEEILKFNAMTNASDRETWVKKHLYPTLNNSWIKVSNMGRGISEQVELAAVKADGLLDKDDQGPLIDTTTSKLTGPNSLYKAWTQDGAEGKQSSVVKLRLDPKTNELLIDGGGPNVQKKLHELREELLNPPKPKPKTRATATKETVETLRGQSMADVSKTAYGVMLEDDAAKATFAQEDVKAYRRQCIDKLVIAVINNGGAKSAPTNRLLKSFHDYDAFEKELLSQCDPKVADLARIAVQPEDKTKG